MLSLNTPVRVTTPRKNHHISLISVSFQGNYMYVNERDTGRNVSIKDKNMVNLNTWGDPFKEMHRAQ